MDEITTTKTISCLGHSFGITLTRECDQLNITKGDVVEVTVRVKKRYYGEL